MNDIYSINKVIFSKKYFNNIIIGVDMRDKFKYKIWKIKNNKIDKIIFYIKRLSYNFENKIEEQGNKAVNWGKETALSLIDLVIVSLLIIALGKIERALYENIFINFEVIRKIVTFSEEYFYQFLIAALGISGVLIALFYANLSGVFSSKYVNLDTSVSFEILKEKENKRNVKSIRNYIITNIALIMFYIMGINFNYLIMILFTLYTVKTIIAFINLSQRIFYFTNLNFITRKECAEIYDNLKRVQVNKKYYKSKEFQNYYKNKTKGNIEKLNKLIETFVKENDFNAIYNFEKTIISMLYNYMINKNKIPYNSLWFEEEYKQKSMLKISDIELITYVNTGVIPSPEMVKNINWVEEELFSLIRIGLEELIKNDKLIYAYEIIEKLDRVSTDAQIYGNTTKILKEEIIICKKINKVFNHNEKNDFYIQAILEIESLFLIGAILKSNIYIQNCKNIIDKITYKDINFSKLLKNNLKIFNDEKADKVCKQIILEKDIEGKVVTGDKYIKEFLYALLYQEINDTFNSYIEILDYIQTIAKNMYNEKKYSSAKIIIAKNIEIYNKIENSYDKIEIIHQEIIKLKKDFTWIDELPKNFKEKLKDYKLNNILLAIKLLGNLDFDKKEKNESEFDIFGLTFYNAYLIANELLNDEDYERYKKIYGYLFVLSNISDIKIKTELKSNGYNTGYVINKYLKPYTYFMDIQGRMIYLSRITNNSKWEDLVKKQVEAITKKEFFETLVEYGNVDKDRIKWDPFRDSIDNNFIDMVVNKVQFKDFGDVYGRRKIISKDEIVKKFNLGDYSFSEIFLCYYVNEKSQKKYIAKYKWNERDE